MSFDNNFVLEEIPIPRTDFSKFSINFMSFTDIHSVLRYCINCQYFTLEETLWGHSQALKTSNMSIFNNFSNKKPILDLNMSSTGHDLETLCLRG